MGPRTLELAAILAHQGGWDEILLVVGPIALIIGVLALVKRRVDANIVGPAETDDVLDDDVTRRR